MIQKYLQILIIKNILIMKKNYDEEILKKIQTEKNSDEEN